MGEHECTSCAWCCCDYAQNELSASWKGDLKPAGKREQPQLYLLDKYFVTLNVTVALNKTYWCDHAGFLDHNPLLCQQDRLSFLWLLERDLQNFKSQNVRDCMSVTNCVQPAILHGSERRTVLMHSSAPGKNSCHLNLVTVSTVIK